MIYIGVLVTLIAFYLAIIMNRLDKIHRLLQSAREQPDGTDDRS